MNVRFGSLALFFAAILVIACTARPLVLAAPTAGETISSAGDETPGPEIRPLAAGAEVPDVTVQTSDGTTLNLRDAVKQKPMVLLFYLGHW